MSKTYLVLLVFICITLRFFVGVTADFWSSDEIQIYLIGLKAYVTDSWPYFGPDVVYTKSQIPGALQGLYISEPLKWFKIPEAPAIILNILSTLSLLFFAWYTKKRFPKIPTWFIFSWILIAPWTIRFGARVVNPSYALIYSILFFVSSFELIIYQKNKILSNNITYFLLGLSLTSIMQLHLSFVLLGPVCMVILINSIKNRDLKPIPILLFFVGILIGASTLIPTIFQFGSEFIDGNENTMVFAWKNLGNLPIILIRFFSFASFEVPYMLGAPNERIEVVKENIWMAPFTIYLLLFGFIQVGLFIFMFFRKKNYKDIHFKRVVTLLLFTLCITYLSFLFSIKNPASHTFHILTPLALFYSFFAYQFFLVWKPKLSTKLLQILILSSIIFHFGLGLYQLRHKSIYTNRQKVEEAIKQRDYTIVGNRRSDSWGKR